MPWFRYRSTIKKVSSNWDSATTSPRHELLESLYAWERRTRGYALYGAPVALEPAFQAFTPHVKAGEWPSLPQPPGQVDSAGRVSLSMLLPQESDTNASPAGQLTPQKRGPTQAVTPAQVMAVLGSLHALRVVHSQSMALLSLEWVASADGIRIQIGCTQGEASTVAAALQGQFPLARLQIGPDALVGALRTTGVLQRLESRTSSHRIVNLGLREAVYRALPLLENFQPDPHAALVATLGALERGEVAGVQLLLSPAQGTWQGALESFLEYFDGNGDGQEKERARALEQKCATPLWAVALRVFAFSSMGNSEQQAHRALEWCRRIVGALDIQPPTSQTSHSNGKFSKEHLSNSLLALDDAGYHTENYQHENAALHDLPLHDLLLRVSRRSGMLLSTHEIAGLWHPPSPTLQHPRLLRFDPHRRELPEYLREAAGVALGTLDTGTEAVVTPQSEPTLVPWPDAYRNRHAYLLGATRMGKSTLLGNLIAQDLFAGRGLCLIDPHGDLAQDVLQTIPPHREDDVLFLDLSDTAFPVSLGLLQACDEWERRLLVSDLLSILHRLFASSWGDRLEHILRHALLTLLADESEAHTLRDIRPLLSDPAYREHLLHRLSDPDLRSFWLSEFPGYNAAAFAPVFNKLGLLISIPLVRNIVAGGTNIGSRARAQGGTIFQQGTLDPAALIQERRILIVNLAQSLIGEDNAHFLGALLVSKIQLAAMHNLRQGRDARMPFTLYVDEFQNFVVSSFAKILSEAGKAGLSLVMANQFLEQLSEGLQTAILSNVGALLSFRVSAASGRRLESEFGGLFSARDLTDLERGQAIVRLGKASDSFALRTFAPLRREDVGADAGAPQRIVARTHHEVCRPRAEVEAGLEQAEAQLEAIRAAWKAEQERKKQEAKGQEVKKPATTKSSTKSGTLKSSPKGQDVNRDAPASAQIEAEVDTLEYAPVEVEVTKAEARSGTQPQTRAAQKKKPPTKAKADAKKQRNPEATGKELEKNKSQRKAVKKALPRVDNTQAEEESTLDVPQVFDVPQEVAPAPSSVKTNSERKAQVADSKAKVKAVKPRTAKSKPVKAKAVKDLQAKKPDPKNSKVQDEMIAQEAQGPIEAKAGNWNQERGITQERGSGTTSHPTGETALSELRGEETLAGHASNTASDESGGDPASRLSTTSVETPIAKIPTIEVPAEDPCAPLFFGWPETPLQTEQALFETQALFGAQEMFETQALSESPERFESQTAMEAESTKNLLAPVGDETMVDKEAKVDTKTQEAEIMADEAVVDSRAMTDEGTV